MFIAPSHRIAFEIDVNIPTGTRLWLDKSYV